MRQNKFFTALILLCTIGFFTTSWKVITPKKQWVSITGTYDLSTFPNTTGTYVASGALNSSGYSTMYINSIVPGQVSHCVVTLYTPDGTITIRAM
jgi:hypothetical protein